MVVNNAASPPAARKTGGYTLIDLSLNTAASANRLSPLEDPCLRELSSLAPPSALGRIGPGDLLHVNLWEPNPTGVTLFSPPALDTRIRVSPTGMIHLPYAGKIKARGKSANRLSAAIQQIYRSQGHAIQALVLDQQAVSGTVVVDGAVAKPGAYPLVPAHRRLRDILAIAGGAKLPSYQASVTVTRQSARAVCPLPAVLNVPAANVRLGPGDTITVSREQRVFYALGAVTRLGTVPFDTRQVTLAAALGRVGGLRDDLAAPRGVFVFRQVSPSQSRTELHPTNIVYRLDLSKPEALFIADRFQMRRGDILYVSDAPAANVAKVLQIVTGISNIAATPKNFGAQY